MEKRLVFWKYLCYNRKMTVGMPKITARIKEKTK